MPKTFIEPQRASDPARHALNGATMGTRWSARFFAPDLSADQIAHIQNALQQAVGEVDAQMSTYQPDSDLMRLNAAPVAVWVDLPAHLEKVLRLGLDIGRASGGAFDMAMGDATLAWGFGPDPAAPEAIRAAMAAPRIPAATALQIAPGRARKSAPLALDLNGIAKGYGVDRLAETLRAHGIASALVGIDGEMRAMGLRPDGTPWTIAVEAPEAGRRTPHSVLALEDAAVATSGDYRHWVKVQGRRLSHTMDPARGAPLLAPPASVTVLAPTCAEADAWATALMVMGSRKGAAIASMRGLNALFLLRDDTGGAGAENAVQALGIGPLFAA